MMDPQPLAGPLLARWMEREEARTQERRTRVDAPVVPRWFDDVPVTDQPAFSAALRSTQNSLPSGSARTTQPEPSGRRRSSTRVAPMPSSRSTS